MDQISHRGSLMTKTKKENEKIPLCIFPKGIDAGIRCTSLALIKTAYKTIKFCGNIECAYHDPIY